MPLPMLRGIFRLYTVGSGESERDVGKSGDGLEVALPVRDDGYRRKGVIADD